MSRRLKITLAAAAVLAALVVAAILYLRSDRFRRYVIGRVVSQIESATGGRAEVRGFQYRLSPVEVELSNLVIHGNEGPEEPPFFAADRILVRLKVTSFFRQDIDWQLLQVDRPRAYIRVDEQSRSNVPEPRARQTEGKGPLDKVFDLALDRFDLGEGVLVYNDQRWPLRFAANDLRARLDYDLAAGIYRGSFGFSSPVPFTEDEPKPVPSNVTAEFDLERGSLQVKRFEWAAPHSRIEATGRLTDFTHPKIRLDYRGLVDAEELAPLFEIPELRAGLARVDGRLDYDTAANKLDTGGNLKLERLAIRHPSFQTSGIQGNAQYQATLDEVRVRSFTLALLGGRISGSAAVNDLKSRPVATISAKAAGLSVPVLLDNFSPPGAKLEELRWAGSVSGDLGLRYVTAEKGPGSLQVKSALRIEPPPVTPAGMLPVNGQVNADYASAGDTLELKDSFIATPASRISASGLLGASGRAATANLQVAADTSNLGEWEPFVASLRPGKPPVPLELKGAIEFRGTVRGRLSAPEVEGKLQAVNFAYDGTHWDSFAGQVAWSQEQLAVRDAVLQREKSSARLNLTADLTRGEFTETSPFQLQAQVQGASIADVQALAGTAYPVTGSVDASIRASGTQRDPRGGGYVLITNGAISGETFDRARANLDLSRGSVQAKDIQIIRGDSRITGEAAYNFDQKRYTFDLAGERIPLDQIEALRVDGLAITGAAGLRARGSGTIDQPSLDGQIQIAGLTVNREPVGDVNASVQTSGQVVNVQLRSKLQRGTLEGDATIRVTGNWPAEGRLSFAGVDLDPLLNEELRGRITTHSSTSGSMTFNGPLKQLEAMNARAELTDFQIAIEKTEMRTVGPLRVALRDGRLDIEQAHLAGPQTDFALDGSVRLFGPPATRTINVRADGAINLALARAIDPDMIGSGRMSVRVNITGTMRRPLFNGRAEFHNAGIAVQDFPVGLSDIRGVVAFDRSSVRFENLLAEAGGGQLRISGLVEHNLGEETPPTFNVQARADEVRVRYPEGTSSVLDANLKLTGTVNDSVLSGDVIVVRERFDPRFDLAQTLGLVRTPTAAPVTSPLLNNMKLDVRLTSSPDLQFEFAMARDLRMEANLRVRGTAARPVVLGRVSLTQGEIMFAGTRYEINRGDINFVNPVRIAPTLHLSLQTRVQQYEVTIDVNGPMDQLSVAYRSDPPLPPSDVQALLIMGRAREDSGVSSASQSLPMVGANTLLSQALNSAVSSRIERIFGVTRLKIDPQVGGPETTPGARVTLEQQITPDVRFTYITNLSGAQQQVVQVEWSLSENWALLAVRDRNGMFGIDLRWRKRFR